MINSKFTLFTVSFILLIFTLYYSNIPFFWDGTLFSELACKFYDKTYTPISFPPYLDNTSFPIYSTYLFAIWTLFSKTLLISHLAFLPFLIGICYEYYKLSKRFLTDTFVSFALILLILEPTFITQSLLMSLDIIPLYLFLVLVNLLLKENFKLYSFIIPVLALYSIRGLVLAFSIIIIQFILLYPKYKKTSFIIFLKSLKTEYPTSIFVGIEFTPPDFSGILYNTEQMTRQDKLEQLVYIIKILRKYGL